MPEPLLDEISPLLLMPPPKLVRLLMSTADRRAAIVPELPMPPVNVASLLMSSAMAFDAVIRPALLMPPPKIVTP